MEMRIAITNVRGRPLENQFSMEFQDFPDIETRKFRNTEIRKIKRFENNTTGNIEHPETTRNIVCLKACEKYRYA